MITQDEDRNADTTRGSGTESLLKIRGPDQHRLFERFGKRYSPADRLEQADDCGAARLFEHRLHRDRTLRVRQRGVIGRERGEGGLQPR